MTNKRLSLLNRQGSKKFNTQNMKPFIKLTKKQYKATTGYNYLYALEYKKRLYRQNLVKNLLKQNFKENSIFFKKLYNKLETNKINFMSSYNMIPLLTITKYNSFLTNSSLWAIQKQTTALKVFPQSSSFWLYSLDQIQLHSVNNQENEIEQNINRKNKLWTAGFVRVRKLRQYYTRQLQNTQKLLYWLGFPTFKKLNSLTNRIFNHNRRLDSMVWSMIQFLDTLWPNIIIKSNFIYNSSAGPSLIKQKKICVNGFFTKNTYTFSRPADIFYKV